jgi:hypothetical protein
MAGRTDLEAQKALQMAKGDKLLAQKELLKQALGNDELLRELVAPYLKGITAQAIERVSRGAVSAPSASPAKPVPVELAAKYNPMRAAEAAAEAPRRPVASSRHVSTLKLLAAAYQAKRGERV